MHPGSARKCTRRVIRFGKYELLSRINIGGMAEIVKARDASSPDDRLVAIKRILPHLCSEPHYKAMFMDEARVLAQLDHPSVIHAYEYGEIEDTPFMALEYVRGHDAREVLHYCLQHGQPMPLGLACYVIARVCEGLQHAHDQTDAYGRSLGVVHRDVSLQNILLGYDGDVKLVDFGIAVSAENLASTEAGIVKGKFGYMSPEQVRGAVLDRRSDVFSAGICLYELLTGQRLFSGESDYRALERVRNVAIEPPRHFNRQIPSSLERVVLRALAKSLRDRYQSANDLRRALQAFLNEARLIIQREDLGTYLRALFAPEFAASDTSQVPAAGSGAALASDSPDTPTEHFEREPEHMMGATNRRGYERGGAGNTQVDAVSDEAATALNAFGPVPNVENPEEGAEGSVASEPVEEGPGPLQMVWNEYDRPPSAQPNVDRVRRSPKASTLAHGAVFELGPGASPSAANRSGGSNMAALPTLELRRSDAELPRFSKVAAATAAGLVALALMLYYISHERPIGELRIQTEPRNATVHVDGKPIVGDAEDRGSPFRVSNLPTESTHTIVVESDGYATWSTTLQLPPDRPFELPLVRLEPTSKPPASALRAEPKPAATEASPPSDPPEPRVQAADDATRVAPSPRVVDAMRTAPSLQRAPRKKATAAAPSARKAGEPAAREPARALPKSAPTVASSRPAATGPTGTLRINTRPWSQVSVDGVAVGNTPQVNLRLKPGKHTVSLRNPEFGVSQTLVLTVKPNEVITRVLTLTPQ